MTTSTIILIASAQVALIFYRESEEGGFAMVSVLARKLGLVCS